MSNENESRALRKISSELLAKVKHLSFYRDLFSYDLKKNFEIAVLRHPGAVVIIPQLENGNFLILKQHRYVLDRFIYEFPAGTLGLHENPDDCAAREVREETGYQSNNIISMGSMWPAPGFCDEIQYLYIAKKLVPNPLPQDEDEVIILEEKSSDQIEAMIIDGQLSDSKSIAAYYKAKLLNLI